MSSLQKQMLKNRLPPMRPKPFSRSVEKGKSGMLRRDYTPLPWRDYFSEGRWVKTSDSDTFRVYTKGSQGPLLLLLHGGGYSGLTWALFSNEICHIVECQVAALDIRGHGETVTSNEMDLSADTLSNDVGNVYNAMYPDESRQPPVVLIGHSMGGAVAVHAAYKGVIPNLIGLIVIDVVEGTALEALQNMQSFLRGRPSSFKSLEYAIEWCVRSGQVRNLESARVSMPSQLKNAKTGEPATKCLPATSTSPVSFNSSGLPANDAAPRSIPRADQIPEIPEESPTEESMPPQSSFTDFRQPSPVCSDDAPKFVWRIDLSGTEEYWKGWFAGLSSLFLSVPAPKLLLLAGVDRLDKDLTIGQMQGKFQMQVLPQCGHAVHEDVPGKVAEAVANFLVRNKFAEPTSNFPQTFPAC
ncbi:protein phosphatase methylesterase 1-like isoform X1 [Dermacentor silvarum]|uniref:protein phosphatase methylesterase 1-like isoform X1 n=1 Tax=Dermacentor silvarum TaxID=543639 RepID=UPI001896C918|nr:protein phosphatase methylesterase 1-like isoform X1 [Dermacentor silvarum]